MYADVEAAAGASGATAPVDDADGIGATSALTDADISEDGPVPAEGMSQSLANGDLSRADGPSSAGMDEDVEMPQRPETEAVHGDLVLSAANGYMDADGTPDQNGILTSPEGREQRAGTDRVDGQPTAIKVSYRIQLLHECPQVPSVSSVLQASVFHVLLWDSSQGFSDGRQQQPNHLEAPCSPELFRANLLADVDSSCVHENWSFLPRNRDIRSVF